MEIITSSYRHCDMVKIKGRVDSSTSPTLLEALNGIMEAGRYKIILDLSGIDFISSAGLRVLIATQKNCKRYNRGEVVLAAIPSNIHSALDLAGFVPLFKIFDDGLSAVGYF
jgi:anti-sigma B factor antagonist